MNINIIKKRRRDVFILHYDPLHAGYKTTASRAVFIKKYLMLVPWASHLNINSKPVSYEVFMKRVRPSKSALSHYCS